MTHTNLESPITLREGPNPNSNIITIYRSSRNVWQSSKLFYHSRSLPNLCVSVFCLSCPNISHYNIATDFWSRLGQSHPQNFPWAWQDDTILILGPPALGLSLLGWTCLGTRVWPNPTQNLGLYSLNFTLKCGQLCRYYYLWDHQYLEFVCSSQPHKLPICTGKCSISSCKSE